MENSIEINLLPWRERARQCNAHQFWMFVLGGILLALGVILLMHVYFQKKIHQQTRINQKGGITVKDLSPSLKMVEDLKKSRLLQREALQTMNATHQHSARVIQLFITLEALIPPGIYLTQVKANGNELILLGIAESASALSEFKHNLEDTRWIKVRFPTDKLTKAFKIGLDFSDVIT